MITPFFHNTFHNIRMNLDMKDFVYNIFYNLPHQILHIGAMMNTIFFQHVYCLLKIISFKSHNQYNVYYYQINK